MACNKSYQKSCARYYNNNAQTLTANGTTTLTLAGKVTLVWMMDGVALPCTAKTVDVAENINTEIHTETDLSLSACCCCVSHTFTLYVITDETAAGSVVQLCAGLLKLA